MKKSIHDLKSQFSNGEIISNEKLRIIKGGGDGTGTITDPRRVGTTVIAIVTSYFNK